jgi:hypothetical protein
VLLLLNAALAQSWTSVGYGVDYAQWSTSDPNRISALRVNLCHPGLDVRATASGERGQKTSAWAGAVGVTAAVNGGFFVGGYAPDQGAAAGNGVAWSDSNDTAVRGWLAFGEHTLHHSVAGAVEQLPSWAEEAVNGDATLVFDGAAVDCGGCGGGRNPRTAVGYSNDGKTLWLVAVDGRSSSSRGMTIDELAVLMDSLGAWRAMNLDGGGSTTLWTSTHGVANTPSDGSERTVANHLGFSTPGIGLSRFCPTGWAAEWGSLAFPDTDGSTIRAPAGSVVRGSMTLKNSGTETWDTELTRLAPLPRDGVSSFQGDDWIAGHRVVAVDATTAPGQNGTFSFSFTMPATVGATERFEFSVLQEGVAWFGNSWGPADGSFYLTLEATDEPVDTGEPPDTDPQDTDPLDSNPPDSDELSSDTSATLPWPRERIPAGCGYTPSSLALWAVALLAIRRTP